LLLLIHSTALAQSGDPYDLSWNSFDGGGTTYSSGGNQYVLHGTIGQADPGLLSGGDYTVGGGFWKGGAQVLRLSIYLPVIVKHSP
jgi:hypothetical protein